MKMKNLFRKNVVVPMLVLSLAILAFLVSPLSAMAQSTDPSIFGQSSETFILLIFSNPWSISAAALTLWAYLLTHNPYLQKLKGGYKQIFVLLTCVGLTLIAWQLKTGLWSTSLLGSLKWQYQVIIGIGTGFQANKWYDNKLFEKILILIKALKPQLTDGKAKN